MKVPNFINRHIIASAENYSKNVKALMVSSVVLDTYGSVNDILNIRNSSQIPEDRKVYAEKSRVAGLAMSVALQIGAGLTVLNDKFQKRVSEFLFYKLKKDGDTELFKKCSKGLKTITGLVFITTVLKRVILPIINSPVASNLKAQEDSRLNSRLDVKI